MCGIAGFLGPGSASDLMAMTRALTHRGPDGEGSYVDPQSQVHLGHRRLAIRDLAGGAQPMWSSDRAVCVVYNGEIYNHQELRAALVAAGHQFQSSHSDTEILVHGYEEWGTDLARRLNGMFAFAILDTRQNSLYLARDRMGEKPLYYYQSDALFAFASELDALVQHSAISAEPSPLAMQKLLAYGYLPAPNALYTGTSKLPAGHQLTVDLRTRQAVASPFWDFSLCPDDAMAARSEDDLAEELRHLLIQAVGRRLVSDVPVGIFLSGGVDSSAILACAAKHIDPAALRTFTIGFSEKSYDESPFAQLVAEHVGSQHQLRMLELEQARDLIPTVLARLDEPLGDPSIVPTFLLSAFTREQVTVALSGDGGDELFAGYDPFKALRPAAAYSRLVPSALHRLLRRGAERLPRSNRNMSFDFKVRRTLQGLSYPESAWAPIWMAPLDPEHAAHLFENAIRTEDVYSEAIELWETGPATNRVDRLLQFFTKLYLQDNILTKVDRAAMMASLESRAVFLDNDLVDFCCRLPNQFKFRNGERKYLLKKALEPLLPKSIIYRRKKGFGIPLSDWMRKIPDQPPLAPITGIRTQQAESLWRSHRDGSADHRLFLWTWWSLQKVVHRTPMAEF